MDSNSVRLVGNLRNISMTKFVNQPHLKRSLLPYTSCQDMYHLVNLTSSHDEFANQ
jgi:hypothetical protein